MSGPGSRVKVFLSFRFQMLCMQVQCEHTQPIQQGFQEEDRLVLVLEMPITLPLPMLDVQPRSNKVSVFSNIGGAAANAA